MIKVERLLSVLFVISQLAPIAGCTKSHPELRTESRKEPIGVYLITDLETQRQVMIRVDEVWGLECER